MPQKMVSLEKLVADTQGFPLLSRVAEQVIDYLNQPDITAVKLAKIIEQNPELSANFLKVVNSPFFGFNRNIYSIHQAVVTLGFNTVKHLILCLSILGVDPQVKFHLDLRKFTDDAFTTAVAAKLIVSHFEPSLEETAFTMGMLMNIGQPLFALYFPQEYRALIKKAQASDKSLNELERKKFLWDHTRLGAMLAKRWGFQDNIIQPIFYHHTYEPPIQKIGKDWILIPIAYIAHCILEVFRSQAKKESLEYCITQAHQRLNLSEDSIHQILENISLKTHEIAGYFGFKISYSFSYSKVLHSINVQLGEMNLTYEQMVKELQKAKVEAEKLAHQLELANEELKKRADLDGLTGIFNHRYFHEHLAVEFMRSIRYNNPLSLLLFDVDLFKKVNDEYGHIAGDEVLKDIALILKKNTRISDIVARYGGEEFAVVLPETNMDNAYLVAEKIRLKVEQYIFLDAKNPLRVTISAGVATVDANKRYETINDLIDATDKKLYRAKRGGRNQVVK
jgi:diguanylate cyclase (GGDEF)-like protein